MGITHADGNLIAKYSYDEWGKLLSIETSEENNKEQQNIAELNPFRYRGYYYDNETGLYYLQSRYYDPDLCRFISADDFSFVNSKKEVNVNAYSYCVNDPINYIDPFGYIAVVDNSALIAFIYEILTIFAEAVALSAFVIAGVALIVVILQVIVEAISSVSVSKEITQTDTSPKKENQAVKNISFVILIKMERNVMWEKDDLETNNDCSWDC